MKRAVMCPSPFARSARFGICVALSACGVSASRAPLGGKYDAPVELATAGLHTPKEVPPDSGAPTKEAEPESAPAKPAPALAQSKAETKLAPALVYQPLKAGDRIKADVTLGFKAELRGGPPDMPANGSLGMASTLRVELKITRASAQALQELELSVTTVSMHTEFAGQGSDAKSEPPEVYDVTLGSSPKIVARNGSKPDAEERAILLVLIAPIAEFHAHWAASPSLDLEPGWSSKVPVTLPSFADGHTESVQVGPLAVRYSGRDSRHLASDGVPFEATLPLKYGADMGKLEFELSGKAILSASSARPTSLELSGPFTALGARNAGSMTFSGSAKFAAQLSYP